MSFTSEEEEQIRKILQDRIPSKNRHEEYIGQTYHLAGTSIGTSGDVIEHCLSTTATLDFGSGQTDDLTVSLSGAATGDPVTLGIPPAAMVSDVMFMGWVSATDTVTIRKSRSGGTGTNPGSGVFRVIVWKLS